MTQETAEALVARVAEYCGREESGVRLDTGGATLLDEAGAKMLSLRADALTRADLFAEPESGAAYVALGYADGKELLLTPMGVAFPPDLVRTGPLPDLPRFVTFRDYQLYRAAAEHPLKDHPDAPPTREMGQALVYCVAILEGARVAGFDVQRELDAISGLLKELDRRIRD